MGALLTKVLQYFFTSAFIKQLLVTLGIGVVTYGVPLLAMEYFLRQFLSTFTLGTVPAMAIALMHIAQRDKAISIVIGAYFVKLHMAATNLVLKKIT